MTLRRRRLAALLAAPALIPAALAGGQRLDEQMVLVMRVAQQRMALAPARLIPTAADFGS
ncbi:hypothetical protein [Rubritepida flocculans]|jgi:hypothetical protein|uniref:hypothetical protein n=1 Tax=Rubritepida flocculans TaxID=182403 RepID=UPI0003F7D295|nr:hypothetical protein [Rubritepida flocculans]